MMSDEMMTVEERKQFRAERREAGLNIDPDTAEIDFGYGCGLEPYGLNPDLPDEARCIGREYFARDPESDDGWVSFHDLPLTTVRALQERLNGVTEKEDMSWLFR